MKEHTTIKGAFSGYRGTIQMSVPAGIDSQREATFYIPQLFPTRPTLSLTTYPPAGYPALFVNFQVTMTNVGQNTEIHVIVMKTNPDAYFPDSAALMLDYLILE
jgi:hypothetical protein